MALAHNEYLMKAVYGMFLAFKYRPDSYLKSECMPHAVPKCETDMVEVAFLNKFSSELGHQ